MSNDQAAPAAAPTMTSTSRTSTSRPPDIGHPKRLTRAVERRWLGGVASGLAEYWDIDPVITRLGFALLTPFGVGFLLYLLGWALIPAADADHSLVGRLFAPDQAGRHRNLQVLLVATLLLPVAMQMAPVPAALLWIFLRIDTTDLLRFLLVLGFLALLGWLAAGGDSNLLLDRLRERFWSTPRLAQPPATQPPATQSMATQSVQFDQPPADSPTRFDGLTSTVVIPTPSEPDPQGAAWQAFQAQQAAFAQAAEERSAEQERAAATLAAQRAEQEAARAARRAQSRAQRVAARAERRERNRWGRLVAAAALIGAGALALTDLAGWTTLGYAGIGIASLGILAAGVLAGAWFGSARWLIAPALVLTLALTGQQAAAGRLAELQSSDPLIEAPTRLSQDGQYLGFGDGNNVLDLTKVRRFAGQSVYVRQGIGTLTLVVPRNVTAQVHSRVIVGHNKAVASQPGWNQAGSQLLTATGFSGQPTPQLFVNAELTCGTFEIKSADAAKE